MKMLRAQAGPPHSEAPNHPVVWDRIVDVCQGIDVSSHLEKTLNAGDNPTAEGINQVTGELEGEQVTTLRSLLNLALLKGKIAALNLKDW
jgi:hypothetical protein